MSTVEANVQSAQYVDFWNDILVPKFIKYKHVLVDALTHHSEAIFPSLPVKEGDRVLDVGCGFGDTSVKLAQRVGPQRQGGWTGLLRCVFGIRAQRRRQVGAAEYFLCEWRRTARPL